jgi:membrane protein DedA with SNARE-associated domain
MEQEIVAFAKNLAQTNPAYAYMFFFLNAVLQVLFPPYPGDTLIIFQGYLSSIGVFNSFSLLLTSLTATFISSIVLYRISFKFGHSIIENKFIRKYFDTSKTSKLEGWFSKYGALAIVINKFIPGVGSLAVIAAGIFKLSRIPAYISIGIATFFHNTMLFLAGRFTGNNMYVIKSIIKEYQSFIFIGLLVIGILYFYIKFYSKNKKTSR